MNHAHVQRVPAASIEGEAVAPAETRAANQGHWSSAHFAADAIAYLARQEWAGTDGPGSFCDQIAEISPDRPIDEPLAAILLHGERRRDDRWLATDASPLPMPNRRRPPPIVAAAEVIDVHALHDDLAHVYVAGLSAMWNVTAAAQLLGLRSTTAAERLHRRYITRP